MSKKVDYTLWRKGTITERFQGRVVARIDYCEVCGRKGSATPGGTDPATGEIWPARWTHTGEIELGLFFMIKDRCALYPLFARLHNSGLLRSRKARKEAKKLIPDTDWPALPLD